jgi:cytochrome oxidase assembly protein ShyY1
LYDRQHWIALAVMMVVFLALLVVRARAAKRAAKPDA